MTKLRLGLVLHLIGRDGGAGFLDQSQREVKLGQSSTELLSILN